MSDGIRCMWMRGGTSKGGYFLGEDLPADPSERDALLLRIMGSPDPAQIDGLGGANPLTSKVAVVRRSRRRGFDIDYLFLQVFVDRPQVSDAQNCGNILAGVGPFSIERGLVAPSGDRTEVRIYMENTGQAAMASVATPGGHVVYEGDARIDGVPGTAAPVPITFEDVAGSSCGALLPTGNAVDEIDGLRVTLIDNGMPVVVVSATDLDIEGYEPPELLDANGGLRRRIERLRLAAGPLMNLGDVRDKSVPKVSLVASPRSGGALTTRTFIPHRCHEAIGALGAVTVATACLLPTGPAAELAVLSPGNPTSVSIEHPAGEMTVIVTKGAKSQSVVRASILRTARKLFDGVAFAR